jgi:putative hydrolase of the HAD superfamily
VLFDLDDTLFAHRQAVTRAITAHRSPSGQDNRSDSAEADRWRSLEEIHYHRYLAGEISFQGQRRARARDFAASYGQELEVDAAADAWFDGYRERYEAAWMLHDDAIDCLARIRASGARVGIITNGELTFQRDKIDRVALAPLIDDLVASGDVGIAKPDRRIFEIACARLAVDTSHAVYVGDRLETDAIGAARAGLQGVWLNRAEVVTAAEAAAAEASGVCIIRSLDELVELLA